MPLLDLPLELLERIAGYLASADITTFSLTSIVCHRASLPTIFGEICLTIHTPEGLRCRVDMLRQALAHSNSLLCIRKVTIKGALTLQGKETRRWADYDPWSKTRLRHELVNPMLDEDPPYYDGMYAVDDEAVIEASSDEDMAWSPLVDLLDAEIALKDFVFDCRSQFPPSLLRVLQQRHSRCRLHHLTFRFRSPIRTNPNPYEMELATSASLTTLRADCSQRDSAGTDDFNLEALMELAGGLAPNLCNVIAENHSPNGALRSSRRRGLWQSLPGFTSGKPALLKSLSLNGDTRLYDSQVLQDWARHVDFTYLQQLTLGGRRSQQRSGLNGETMQWISQTHSFPNLKSLCVQLCRDDSDVERPHYTEQAVSFFQSLEPLQQLAIDGSMDDRIINAVLAHHGQTLRKLDLHPFEEIQFPPYSRESNCIPFDFTKDCIEQLRDQCPILEKLTILITRSMSSASEVELYRCFATFENLRDLSLILDCSNWRVRRDRTYEPDFDEQDNEPVKTENFGWLKKGELRRTYINCAVDEALASSIWGAVCHNKAGTPLQRLRLWPVGAGELGSGQRLVPTATAIVQNLARSWLCERNPWHDKEDFTIVELRREKRIALNEYHTKSLRPNQIAYDAGFWTMFRSIWPPQNGVEDYRIDGWSSFPLQEKSQV